MAGGGILLTLADTRVTVRLSRDIWDLEPRPIELARAVSTVAREQAAVADRAAVQEVQIAVAAKSEETSTSGVPSWGTRRWPTTMRSIRSGIARPSGRSRSIGRAIGGGRQAPDMR